jgi:hypothetical protein
MRNNMTSRFDSCEMRARKRVRQLFPVCIKRIVSLYTCTKSIIRTHQYVSILSRSWRLGHRRRSERPLKMADCAFLAFPFLSLPPSPTSRRSLSYTQSLSPSRATSPSATRSLAHSLTRSHALLLFFCLAYPFAACYIYTRTLLFTADFFRRAPRRSLQRIDALLS